MRILKGFCSFYSTPSTEPATGLDLKL